MTEFAPESLRLAQTNLQLFVEARAFGYNRDEISALQRDCETAGLMCGYALRPCGKPFLSHLVGAASALIKERQPFVMVRAAINHAAYEIGRFPTGARGLRLVHRKWLRSRVGDEVEALIAAYRRYIFGPDPVAELVRGADLPSGQDRRLLIMRLCNEVDDAIEFAAVVDPKPRWRDNAYVRNLQRLSQRLDLHFCRAAFQQAEKELSDAEWLGAAPQPAYETHRQSLPRYLKGLVSNWARD